MLLIPYVVGAAAAGSFGLDAIAGLAAVLMLYVSRPGFMLLLKRRIRSGSFGAGAARLLGGSSLLAGAALLIFAWLWLMRGFEGVLWTGIAGLVISVAHSALSLRRRERSAAVEFAGIALLTLTAPLAYHLASGDLGKAAAGLWLLNALYFGSSVYFVKMKLRASVEGRRNASRPLSAPQKMALARNTISYLFFMAAAVAAALLAGLAPALSWPAILPVILYMAVSMARLSPEVDIKREGWAQAVLSLIFASALIAAYHL